MGRYYNSEARVANRDFFIEASLGRIDGYSGSIVVGINPDIDEVEETLWCYGGTKNIQHLWEFKKGKCLECANGYTDDKHIRKHHTGFH